jgi:hypothetical protein
VLLGKGAFVAWHDIAAGREADYDRWHSQEHMLERVGIDGFRRGRRYVATGRATSSFTKSPTLACSAQPPISNASTIHQPGRVRSCRRCRA